MFLDKGATEINYSIFVQAADRLRGDELIGEGVGAQTGLPLHHYRLRREDWSGD